MTWLACFECFVLLYTVIEYVCLFVNIFQTFTFGFILISDHVQNVFIVFFFSFFRVKDERPENEQSPNTSVSSMSPLSDRSEPSTSAVAPEPAPPSPQAAAAEPPHQAAAPFETMRHLQTVSHRGYGAPVSSWNGNHSAMSRQVICMRKAPNVIAELVHLIQT